MRIQITSVTLLVMISLLALSSSAAAFGYNAQGGSWQNVALPGSGHDCSSPGCVGGGLFYGVSAWHDEQSNETNACIAGPGGSPTSPPPPGLQADGGLWTPTGGSGAHADATACANLHGDGSSDTWTRMDVDRYAPTNGDHVGACGHSHDVDPRNVMQRADVDGIPAAVGNGGC